MEIIIIVIMSWIVGIIGIYFYDKYIQDKIRMDASRKGFTITKISWDPFHLGGKGTNFYRVAYLDKYGFSRKTLCKVSWLGSVQWDTDTSSYL